MTEPGDEKVSLRYRELAREEPAAHADAAILAAARERAAGKPGTDATRMGRSPRWMGPISIAAVLVLGIGVSLRMQLEKPGVETSMPSSAPSEYSVPSSAEPARDAPAQAPMPESARADSSAPAAPVPAPEAVATPPPARQPDAPLPRIQSKERAAGAVVREETKRNIAPEPVPNPFTDAPVTMQAPIPVSPPVTTLSTAASPPPAAASPAPLESRTAPQAAPRAKREAGAADAASGARELRKATAEPDPDPLRELERIAALRAAGNHAEADRALEQFRRRHPDFRIPEALWERVRAR